MKTALLVIDVQQGLCEGEHDAFESQQVIDRINKVSRKARAAGVLVVFVQHESRSGELEFGTDGWQLARGLDLVQNDLRIRKTTPDSFHGTALAQILKAHAVTGPDDLWNAHRVLCRHNYSSGAGAWLPGRFGCRRAYNARQGAHVRSPDHSAPQCHTHKH